jgi:hypothetical protein
MGVFDDVKAEDNSGGQGGSLGDMFATTFGNEAAADPNAPSLGLDKIHQSDAVVVTGSPWSADATSGTPDSPAAQYTRDHKDWKHRLNDYIDGKGPDPGAEPVDPGATATYGSRPGGKIGAGGGSGSSHGQDVSPYMKHNGSYPYSHYGD